MFRRLSIRAILGATIAAMGALIILLAGVNLRSAIQRDGAAQRVVTMATIDGHVFDALLAMRVERGTMLGALVTADPADAAAVARLTDNRALSEVSYSKAEPLLANVEAGSPELAAAIARLRTAREAMTTLRSQTDAVIRLNKSARDVAVIQSVGATSQAYHDALVAVGDALENAMKLVSPEIDQLMAIKKSAWAARLYSGALAVRTETALAAGRTWQLADFVGGAEDRGRMNLAWAELTAITARPETSHQMAETIATAAAVFPTVFAAQLAAELLKGPDTPLDATALQLPELQRRNGAEFSLLNDIATRALTETRDLAANQADAAQHLLILNVATLLLAVGLTLGGYLIAVRRISAPIGAMTHAMRSLADHGRFTRRGPRR